MAKQWNIREGNVGESKGLADTLGLSPITAKVLVNRGIVDIQQAQRWLSTEPSVGHDPFLMADMECAVKRLKQAVDAQEQICCYGDYDVDGISATSLYLLFLRQQGALVNYYIPDRQSEGYGLNEQAVERLAREGVKVLVTIDCGTTSHQEVLLANRLGIDVIITDHHQIHGDHPEAHAFLNPQRKDCLYPFKGLCSGGLALKVASAYLSRFGSGEAPIPPLVDLAALATIADMVPLEDENRWLVREGLQHIGKSSRCGMQALKQAVGMDGICTEGMVAFRLAPTVNAAGRLAHARLGVELFTSQSAEQAASIARQLEQLNRQRREIEHETVEDAISTMEGVDVAGAVVVGHRAWHVGVVGIVASRLVERFYRPAVVVAFDEQGFGRGSVRSIPGVDVCQLLGQCVDLLEGFGGHPAAAGLQIQESKFSEFRDRLSKLAHEAIDPGARIPTLHIDAEVRLQDLDFPLLRELEQLHPFGIGNPEPLFLGQQVKVLEQRRVGENHLKIVVRQENSLPFDCMGFRMGDIAAFQRLEGQCVDVVFVPEINRWRGMDRIQLRIRDMRVSEKVKVSACS